MPRFAHIADCHIGAWRDLRLRELNMKAFEMSMDVCIEEKVDFIIIAGDLFHVNVPDLGYVQRTVEKLREVRDRGIQIYVIYGSHDYNPNTVSIVDVLNSSGLFQKVVDAEFEDDKLVLSFFQDSKTKAKIVGLSGRTGTLERMYYTMLDRERLESEPGFKVFVLHSAIGELKPVSMAFLQGVPLSNLPQGFSYYAGGHIHKRIEETLEGYGHIVYPGPLFGATFTDLEDTAKGERRGFYLVDFNKNSVKQVQFIETSICDVTYSEVDADKKTANQVEQELFDLASTLEASGKIVLVRVKGTLSTGKVSDIDFRKVRNTILEQGAEYVFLNRRALTIEKGALRRVIGDSIEEIEGRLLRDSITSFTIDPTLNAEVQKLLKKCLASESGLQLASDLLKALKMQHLEGEKKATFEGRVLLEALRLLPEEAVK